MKAPSFITALVERISELDIEYAIDAMGGSESLYEKTLMHMVRHIPINISQMDDFLFTNEDLNAFAIKTHGIKSALRHVGKMVLANEAESLEKAAKAGDKTYCTEHYGIFKRNLLHFFDQVNEVTEQTSDSGKDTEKGFICDSDISDYIDALKQAREAADSCDSMSAYDILLPLTKIRFEKDVDDLVMNAANALDLFKPYEALEHITELLKKSKKSK